MRSTDDASHRSYPALQATKGGSSRGNFPLDPVLLPFAGAKGRPRRRGVLAWPRTRPATPTGDHKPAHKNLLLPFLQEKPPRRVGVLTMPCIRLRDADRRLQASLKKNLLQTILLRKATPAGRREETMMKGGRGGWGAGLRWAEDGPPPAGGTAHVHTTINYHTTKRRKCQCVILWPGIVVFLGQNCYTGV